MDPLRALFPTVIADGAVLRADGTAVGLAGGGAPAWALVPPPARAAQGVAYQRLLMALDGPLDIYIVDRPPDVASAIADLRAQQMRSPQAVFGDVLGEVAEYLLRAAQQGGTRAKEVIWAITVAPAPAPRTLGALGRRGARRLARPVLPGQVALSQAVAQIRRLTVALGGLGGTPHVLTAAEIAALLYTLADPMRARYAPLAGALHERLRYVVSTDHQELDARRGA